MWKQCGSAGTFGVRVGLVLAGLTLCYFLAIPQAAQSRQRFVWISAHGPADFVQHTIEETDRRYGQAIEYGLEGVDLVLRTIYRFQQPTEFRIPYAVFLIPLLLVVLCGLIPTGIILLCWGIPPGSTAGTTHPLASPGGLARRGGP